MQVKFHRSTWSITQHSFTSSGIAYSHRRHQPCDRLNSRGFNAIVNLYKDILTPNLLLQPWLTVRRWVSDSRVLYIDGCVPGVHRWRVLLHGSSKYGLSLLQEGIDSLIVVPVKYLVETPDVYRILPGSEPTLSLACAPSLSTPANAPPQH